MVLQKTPITFIFEICIFLFFFFSGLLFSGEYDIILKRNLFAPVPVKKENKKEIVKILKFPPLDEILDLKGTFVMKKNPSNSLAIIEIKKKNQMDFYHIGDIVAGAKIIDIKENKIFMEYGFQNVILSNKGWYLAPVNPDYTYEVDITETIMNLKKESRSLFNLKCKPVIENGKVIGYRISGIKMGSIIEKLGIKNGDIIKKVNTVPVVSEKDAFMIYQNIMKYGIERVVVKILRNNFPYTLLYHLRGRTSDLH